MLPCLTIAKKTGKQAQSQPSLTGVYGLLKSQSLVWERTEFAFHGDGCKANAIKSLRAIAKQNAWLQPYYRQKSLDSEASKSTGGWGIVWKTQDYAEAVADKNKKLTIRPFIEWALPADAPDCEETLRAIEKILADYPQKNYQYHFQAHFLGLQFGAGTLAEAPESYAKGRGPALKEGVYDVLHGMKWAYSHVRYGRDKFGSNLLCHCLLEPSSSAPAKESALPDTFVRLATALQTFKPKEVLRREIYSVQESDDHYAKLTPAQRDELDTGLVAYLIGRERTLYRQVIGLDFAEPLPATADIKAMYAYLQRISHTINLVRKQTVRVYSIVKLRQSAAKAVLEGSFTSFDALELETPEDVKLTADRERREQLIKEAQQSSQQRLDAAMAAGKLPHRLEDYYFPEGILRQVGQTEDGRVILESIPNPNPGQTSYVPYHQLWVPDDQPVPPSLQAIGYQRDPVRLYFEQMKQVLMVVYRNPVHALGHFKKTTIDGVECFVVATDREQFNRRKILGDIFKSLGYGFVKQPQGSVGLYQLRKPLSEAEYLNVDFDFGTWRQSIVCVFAYENASDQASKLKGFRLHPTGWSYLLPVEISSEDLFTKTIENIAAMVAIVEKEEIPELRQALATVPATPQQL